MKLQKLKQTLRRTAAALLAFCMLVNTADISALANNSVVTVPKTETEHFTETASGSEADPAPAAGPESSGTVPEDTPKPAATSSDAHFIGGYEDSGFTPEKVGNVPGLYSGDIPSQYDTREHYSVRQAQDQGSYGTCTSFTATALAEINTLLRTGQQPDYSEGAMAYFTNHHPADPLGLTSEDHKNSNYLDTSLPQASYTYWNGIGPVSEATAPYANVETGYPESAAYPALAQLTDARWYEPTDRLLIKQAIMDYGAVGIGFHIDDSYGKYADGTTGPYYYYYNGSEGANHAVTIVGWDDTIDKSNFAIEPEENGAWLVRNSWGTDWGDNGYCWISFYDSSLDDFTSMSFVSPENGWDNRYFYDGTGRTGISRTVLYGRRIGNIFQASGDETLEAVSISLLSANVSYNVQIFKNDSETGMHSLTNGTPQLSTPVTGTTAASGIYTIRLPKAVELNEGDYFSVVFTFDDETAVFLDQTGDIYVNYCKEGQSFIESYDLAEEDACLRIRAFTNDNPSYTVSYELNGGTNNAKNPETYKTTAAQTLYSPTRVGYTFAGWYLNENFSGSRVKKIAAGSTGNLTLYAKWTANCYTVKFNGNGSTSGSMNSLSCICGTGTKLTANQFKKTGAPFCGWNTKADGTGDAYDNKAEINLLVPNKSVITLYAQWYYRIDYVLNSGTNHIENPSSYTGLTDIVLKNPIRKGYTFSGWYANPDFTGSRIKKITAGSKGNRKLYAKWTANCYTVKFNGNGSTSGTMASASYTYGKKAYLPANTFAKDGFTFLGWNTKADGSGTSLTDQQNMRGFVAANKATVTLYAQWGYTITYVLNGGTNSSDNPSWYTGSIKILLKDPTKKGYTFKGWYKKADFSGTRQTGIAKGGTGNRTFYAKWEANKYTIQFNGNGNTSGSMDSVSWTYNSTSLLPANKFKKTGYTFTGWNTKKDGSGTAISNNSKVPNLTATAGRKVTLYAQWTANTYNVRFHSNNGTGHMDAITGCTYDVEFQLPLNTFTRTGNKFAGWNTKPDGTGTAFINQGYVKNLTGTANRNVTLYAQWTYTIQFNANGGTGSTKSMKNCLFNKDYSLTSNAFYRAGYTFICWNTKKNGTGTDYADGATVRDLRSATGSTVTLYAQWGYRINYILYPGINNSKNPASYNGKTEIVLYDPTRKGYTFDGWYDNSTFSGSRITRIEAGTSGEKTLYAKWVANTYQIAFDKNGGKGSMDTISCTYDKSVALPKNQFTRTGYTFTGWNTKADGSGKKASDEKTVSNVTAVNNRTVTLYAQWGYTITYVLNGGTNSTKNPNTYMSAKGAALYNPTRKGYTFGGWYTKKNFASSSKVTSIAQGSKKNKTLYAKWTANTYTIKFNRNGGTGSMSNQTFSYDSPDLLTENSFTRSGYAFTGWNTKQDGSGTFYADNENVSNLTDAAGGTVTLYAQWMTVSISVSKKKYNKNTIHFTAWGDYTGIQIYRRKDTGSYSLIATITDKTKTEYTDSGLDGGTLYRYYARIYRTVNGSTTGYSCSSCSCTTGRKPCAYGKVSKCTDSEEKLSVQLKNYGSKNLVVQGGTDSPCEYYLPGGWDYYNGYLQNSSGIPVSSTVIYDQYPLTVYYYFGRVIPQNLGSINIPVTYDGCWYTMTVKNSGTQSGSYYSCSFL